MRRRGCPNSASTPPEPVGAPIRGADQPAPDKPDCPPGIRPGHLGRRAEPQWAAHLGEGRADWDKDAHLGEGRADKGRRIVHLRRRAGPPSLRQPERRPVRPDPHAEYPGQDAGGPECRDGAAERDQPGCLNHAGQPTQPWRLAGVTGG